MSRGKWAVGTQVSVTLTNGTRAGGQVWAPTETRNYVWVALDSGRFVAVFIPTGTAYEQPSSTERVGKVAA